MLVRVGAGVGDGVAADLGQRQLARGQDGGAARHRLEHREPEALPQARVGHDRGARQVRGEVRERQVARAQHPQAVGHGGDGRRRPRCPSRRPPASTSAGGARVRRPPRTQPRTRAGTFLRGSSVPRNATYGRSRRGRASRAPARRPPRRRGGTGRCRRRGARRGSARGRRRRTAAPRSRSPRTGRRARPRARRPSGWPRVKNCRFTGECSSGWEKNVASCSVTTTGTDPPRGIV